MEVKKIYFDPKVYEIYAQGLFLMHNSHEFFEEFFMHGLSIFLCATIDLSFILILQG